MISDHSDIDDGTPARFHEHHSIGSVLVVDQAVPHRGLMKPCRSQAPANRCRSWDILDLPWQKLQGRPSPLKCLSVEVVAIRGREPCCLLHHLVGATNEHGHLVGL